MALHQANQFLGDVAALRENRNFLDKVTTVDFHVQFGEQAADSPTPTCVPTCTAAADCAVPGAPLSDKTHYLCKSNRCEWQGCRNTQECKSALQSNRVVCE